MERESTQVPPWLEPLLRTPFFIICSRHRDTNRNECNMFCLSCQNAAFCFYCRSSLHKDHPVIQIRRSSYHDVVRVSEIQNLLDIRGVQTYVINSARVLFLNERPQPKSSNGAGKSVSYFCEICGRSLLDPFRFCSLGCKLVGMRKNNSKEGEGEEEEEERSIRKGSQQEKHKGTHSPTHVSNSRRRKGIPHRAPFAS